MFNAERRRQFVELMSDSGWDVLLLYGHSWRKDFFRSLINFNFFGPHAVAALTKSNELVVGLSNPWDYEILKPKLDAKITWNADFTRTFSRFISSKTAIAGRELMEARWIDESTISATVAIETLRRFKTAEEIEFIKQA